MVRVTAGVEAHTHEYISTSHEDQKFGFSITGGDALAAVTPRRWPSPALRLLGLHSHIGSQIFVTDGFEVAARRVLRLHADIALDARRRPPRARPRRRVRHRLHDPGRPRPRPTTWPAGCARSSTTSARAIGIAVPRLSVEPGRAIAGPSTFTLYEVGTIKDGRARRWRIAALRLGRRRDERQHPYRPSTAPTTRALSRRGSSSAPAVLSRVVGKHCESGDIVVKDEYLPGDVRAGRPARGARHRCVLPLAGQQRTTTCPAPPWSPSATARPGCCCAARPSTTSSRSTRASAGLQPAARARAEAREGVLVVVDRAGLQRQAAAADAAVEVVAQVLQPRDAVVEVGAPSLRRAATSPPTSGCVPRAGCPAPRRCRAARCRVAGRSG